MELAAFLSAERGRGAHLARALNIPPAWLSQMAAGTRPVPPVLAPQIEAETAFAVRRWDLRPTDWYRIWPELRGTEGAPEAPDIGPTSQPGALDEAEA